MRYILSAILLLGLSACVCKPAVVVEPAPVVLPAPTPQYEPTPTPVPSYEHHKKNKG